MERGFTFSSEIIKYLKNKSVEVYMGDTFRVLKYSEFDDNKKEVIRGTLIDSSGDLLILEVTDKLSFQKNIVYINGYSVKAILEPKNGIGIIDVFSGEYEKQPK